jgi:putative phosphoribosyl transferase
MQLRFEDRREAGRYLASKLTKYDDREDALVLGLPRGGIPVAFEVAHVLHLPLDVFLVRKLGVPGHEELAMGAISTGEVRVLNQDVINQLSIDEKTIDRVARQEMQELHRRQEAYRGDRPEPQIEGRTVILVDDGLATGATMMAAVTALRQQNPAGIVVAVPTASQEICSHIEKYVDEVVCAITPDPFWGVGLWYENFEQTTDAEVRKLLLENAERIKT